VSENLTFSCPHCQHHYADELELLDTDDLHDFQCENCSKAFTALLKECSACAEETVFVWIEPPPATVLAELCCGACGTRFLSDDEPIQYD